ncbi:hypothetical protein QEN19_002015 [Hanseniaspora menglaensis]
MKLKLSAQLDFESTSSAITLALFAPKHSNEFKLCVSINSSQILLVENDPYLKKKISEHRIIDTDHHKGINDIQISCDGQVVASASDDSTIELTHLNLGKLSTCISHTAPVTAIKFSSKGNILFSGSLDENLKSWNLSASGILTQESINNELLITGPLKTMSAHSDCIISLDVPFFDSSILATGSYDGLIRIFDTSNGNCLKTLTYDKDWANDGHVRPIVKVSFSVNGKYLLVKSLDGVVKLWDYLQGRVVRTFHDEEKQLPINNHITGLDFLYSGETEDSKVYVVNGTQNGRLEIFDVMTKNKVVDVEISKNSVSNVKVMGSDKIYCLDTDNRLFLYTVEM